MEIWENMSDAYGEWLSKQYRTQWEALDAAAAPTAEHDGYILAEYEPKILLVKCADCGGDATYVDETAAYCDDTACCL